MLVSCRTLRDALTVCDARGVDLDGLTDGLGVAMHTLRSTSGTIQWSELAIIMDRLSERMGGPEAYGSVVAEMLDHPDTLQARRFLRVTSSPHRNYMLVFKWASRFIFPFVKVDVEVLPGHRIRVVHRIDERHPGSLPFMTSALSFARVIPRVHGLPDAKVELLGEVSDRLVDFIVDVPRPPRFALLRRWWAFAKDGPGVMEEVLRQSHELGVSNLALKELYAEAKVREEQLAEEIRLKNQAEVTLLERDRQLAQAQRLESLGRLAGGVAHDFNNLLTAILGEAELLQMRTEDPHTLQGLEHIRDAGERAAALTRQLLTFAKQQPVAREAVDLSAQIASLEPLLRRLLGKVSLQLQVPSSEVWIAADPVQLEQVLVNLCLNGADAMGGEGELVLRVVQGEEVIIEVVDTGVGMSAEVVERIFEPFFTTKGKLGTGLGLAIVYGVVTEAGGRLDVESAVGQGTTFRVTWPLLEASDAASPAKEQQLRVLVIDDEPALRRLIGTLLEREGYAVDLAADRAEAVHLARGGHYDVVVSDVMLKHERGPEVVQEIRRHIPGLRVLYVTGFGDAATLKGLAGERVLAKPFGRGALAAAVQSLLQGTPEKAPEL